MDNSLLTEINTEINLKEEFAEWIGIAYADIPEEILTEAGFQNRTLGMPINNPGGTQSAARGRASEMDWVQSMKGDQERQKPSTYRDPTTGNPEMARAEQGADPKAGDFVVVDGQPMKVADVKQIYGDSFIYVQGMKKPIIVSNLKLAKRVGKINVFKKLR